MKWHRFRKKQQGFSLLELLVAFAIMALSIGMIYRATGANVRNVVDVEQYQHANILAESLMSLVDGVPPSGLEESRISEGFTWTLRTSPWEQATAVTGAPQLYQVHLHVSWSERGMQRQVDLTTLRPQRAPARQQGSK